GLDHVGADVVPVAADVGHDFGRIGWGDAPDQRQIGFDQVSIAAVETDGGAGVAARVVGPLYVALIAPRATAIAARGGSAVDRMLQRDRVITDRDDVHLDQAGVDVIDAGLEDVLQHAALRVADDQAAGSLVGRGDIGLRTRAVGLGADFGQ